jgi:hypothetical protein
MSTTLEAITNMRAEADEMLKQHVADNPDADAELLTDLLTPTQRHLLNMAGFNSPFEVQMEVGRVRVVADLKAQAGTVKARKAAEKAANDAAKMLNTESAAIKSAIAEAQAKLTLLEREARDAAAKRDAMLTAVDHLRSDRFLPKHVVETAAFARRRVKASGDAETLRELDSRIGTLTAVAATDQTHEQMISHCKSHGIDALDIETHPLPNGSQQRTCKLNAAKWSAYADACKAELAKLKPQAEKLRAKVDEELSLCEGCRSHYVDQLG